MRMSRILPILVGVLLVWWLLMAVGSLIVGNGSRALWFGALFLFGMGLILWRRRGAKA